MVSRELLPLPTHWAPSPALSGPRHSDTAGLLSRLSQMLAGNTCINTQARLCPCAHTCRCIVRHTQACMSVCPCIFVCPHKYKSVHVQHTCGSAHKNVHIHMHTYPHVCVYPCADACAHCTSKNMHVHFMHTSAHACMCLCMYTDVPISASLSFANLQAP